jgi:hypothetical protein
VRTLAAGAASTVAILVLVIGTAARAETSSARAQVLDQTYSCAVFFRGGAYVLEARAQAGTLRKGSWAKLPYAGIRSGVFSGGGGPGNLLAWMTAGKPVATTMIDDAYDAFDVRTWGTVGVRREGCRRTSASIPLSVAGLTGGDRVTPLGSKSECFVPKQVIVRLRAVLVSSGSLRTGEDFQTTHVPVREAELAARTVKGKPLVYAEVRDDGTARLFTAPGCSSD